MVVNCSSVLDWAPVRTDPSIGPDTAIISHSSMFGSHQVDDVYWGWNNEVHVFDPNHASWTEPQTNVCPPYHNTVSVSMLLEKQVW